MSSKVISRYSGQPWWRAVWLWLTWPRELNRALLQACEHNHALQDERARLEKKVAKLLASERRFATGYFEMHRLHFEKSIKAEAATRQSTDYGKALVRCRAVKAKLMQQNHRLLDKMAFYRKASEIEHARFLQSEQRVRYLLEQQEMWWKTSKKPPGGVELPSSYLSNNCNAEDKQG